jgi:hypothetical protein
MNYKKKENEALVNAPSIAIIKKSRTLKNTFKVPSRSLPESQRPKKKK